MAVQSAEGYYLYTFHPFKSREEPGKVEHRAQAEQQALAIRLAADTSPAPARRRAGRRSARSRAARAP